MMLALFSIPIGRLFNSLTAEETVTKYSGSYTKCIHQVLICNLTTSGNNIQQKK